MHVDEGTTGLGSWDHRAPGQVRAAASEGERLRLLDAVESWIRAECSDGGDYQTMTMKQAGGTDITGRGLLNARRVSLVTVGVSHIITSCEPPAIRGSIFRTWCRLTGVFLPVFYRFSDDSALERALEPVEAKEGVLKHVVAAPASRTCGSSRVAARLPGLERLHRWAVANGVGGLEVCTAYRRPECC